MRFQLISDYAPMGDQPEAIAQLVKGVKDGIPAQTLLGVTGSGKTFTMATVNDELKNIAQIEHSRHRSSNNFIANAVGAIAAYCFFDKKPAIDVEFINDGQLSLF